MNKNNNIERKQIGFLAFAPLLIFLALYIGIGLYFTLQNAESPFSIFPRHIALFVGIGVALIMQRQYPVSQKIDIICENMGNSGVMMIGLIYLLAGGFQGAAAVMGGKESVVNFSLTHIPPSLLVPGIFVMGAFISTAIGTSMGTIAALAPIAISVAEGANLNLALTSAAVIGGAYFGDNLSMISDTTISATQGVGAEMKDKFRMNFLIALPAAIIAAVLYGFLGGRGVITEVLPYDLIRIIPYLSVLIAALMGVNVAVVLFIGILMTGVIGLAQGSVTFFEWVGGIGSGMSDMFSITIVAILVSGIIGIVKFYGGVEWLVEKITSKINSRKGAEYGISFLVGILSAALINNTIGIIISAPIAKEIGEKYHIAPKRLASLLDIFACAFLALMPHDGGMLIVTGLSQTSPLEVLKYAYYIFALIIVALLSIQFGWLRTAEEKSYDKK
ncbi:Na+/H+ antiporter NhaC family protein [Peptoniphilus sp. BV3AC2]|uniref:Na+/H+ antiporter NhaC family protein n=1 Tax=Peptoniphilus sp. BV3AC2 TaxID=1111133 RepID=UPI0003B8C1EE|nr:Na+/H+ antiporter NhaC family protein [Peptoniphilus sp. BV3AC2]ERT63520.1 Na+/H+ antiporter family protein [Peptoniphilus sp. BV3AC2]